MSKPTWTDGDSFASAEEMDRMLRVSPLTIGAVYKRNGEVGQGYVLNLSRGGVFFTAKRTFDVGEKLRLRFFLPFQIGQVDATVVVRWRTTDVEQPPAGLPRGMGLEFVRIEPGMRDRISAFIEKFVALADMLGGG